ncbi:hypothetical protein Q7P35_003899 [Cladosporium inversicolor]
MLPQASDDCSPSRTALDKPLTLNKKQSWFGSFRSVVHRSALSAKAAVESLRGNQASMYVHHHANMTSFTSATDQEHSTSASDRDLSTVSPIKCATPDQQSARAGSPTPRSAIASLRQNLSRHSRRSGRGSVSSVFRRSVDAFGLRGTYDPETIVRNSQNTRKTTSPLGKDGNKSRDPATLVPLPSSPIDIPVPLPVLRVDLGPPAMLSPFQMTHSDLAEIRVLQDPTNITTGIPQSCPLNWKDKDTPLRMQPRATVASSEIPDMGSYRAPVTFHPVVPLPSHMFVSVHDDPLEHRSSNLMRNGPPSPEESHVALLYEHPRRGSAPREVDCDDAFQDSCSLTKVSHHSTAASNRIDGTTEHQSLEYTRPVSKVPSHEASAATLQTQLDHVSNRKDLPDDVIDVLLLPSPVVALRKPSSECSDASEQAGPTNASDTPTDSNKASVDTEVSRAQKKYRDSLAGLEEGLELENLDPEVTRHVEQNPFVGATGTPAPLCRSLSIVPAVHPSPSDENFDAIQIPSKSLDTADYIREDKENCRDGLAWFEETKHGIVHQHGPPSPERRVMLPFRPKTMTQHTSFESTIFKPILDRVAAKHLGVFRPGSDPTLRQKYFPHTTVSTSSPVRYPGQPSVDLDDTESDDTESCDVGLFERAIERPPPLHIRKLSNNTPVHAPPSPQTPASTSTLQAPGSSPIRTPSMGDRQLFDLQRAEREARYNAILSGKSPSTVMMNNSEIQLAEFGNAGPGSKGSTPTRSSGGRGQRRMSPTYLQRMLGQDPSHTPSPKFGVSTFMALSRD